MAAHAQRLARLFTPTYCSLINAQIVYPAPSRVIKPNELQSALARPLQVAHYEPHKPAPYLAATLSYGIIQGHPFMDGNKRTAFFLANEYLRAQGLAGLADEGKLGKAYEELLSLADRHIEVAKGNLDVDGLAANGKGALFTVTVLSRATREMGRGGVIAEEGNRVDKKKYK